MSQGRHQQQTPLFMMTEDIYRHVPRDPFYQRLASLIDWSFIYDLTRPYYADKGRPSIDPVVFVKCLLFGLFEQVPGYRALELRIAESLTARRWIGYTLTEKTPDESTLRKTVALFSDEVFSAIFDCILVACHRAGMVSGRHLGVDSTTTEALAGMESLRHRELGCSYRDYLAILRQTGEPAPKTISNTEWVSATEPDARIAKMKDGHYDMAYKVNLATDLATGIVVGVDVTTADVSDRFDLMPPLEDACVRLDTLGEAMPATVTADKGYHDGEGMAAVEELGITPVIRPLPPPQESAPGFAPSDFVLDQDTDMLTCPAGHLLRRQPGEEHWLPAGWQVYRASGAACRACPHFGTCTKDKKGRKVKRSSFEAVLKANAARAKTEEAKMLFRMRQTYGEAPFSFGKRGSVGRIWGRGMTMALKQTYLTYAAWNCLRLINRLACQSKAKMASELVEVSVIAVISLLIGVCLAALKAIERYCIPKMRWSLQKIA